METKEDLLIDIPTPILASGLESLVRKAFSTTPHAQKKTSLNQILFM